MNWIKVYCFTNLDMYSTSEWPNEMCCRPIKGDKVTSNKGKSLKVVSVTHTTDSGGIPCLSVELHN